jgi:C-terminal processing protease CtpA/Prc
MTPEDFQTDTTLTGSFEGIGATVSSQNNEIVIVAPIKDTSAEKAGLKGGDVIMSVDGESTKGWSVEKTVLRIRGPRGTTVTLSIRHQDGKTEEYKLVRQTVQVESVTSVPPGGTLKDSSGATVSNIGYVHIREFSRRTAQEMEAAVKEQVSQGAKALIIDVRSNPGGLLNTTIQLARQVLGNHRHQRDGRPRSRFTAPRPNHPAQHADCCRQNRWLVPPRSWPPLSGTTAGPPSWAKKSFGKGTVNTPVSSRMVALLRLDRQLAHTQGCAHRQCRRHP